MLAILTSHPIQYQAPLWRALAAAGMSFEVWFLTPHALKPSHDREFGQTFAWDQDLTAGYAHRFVPIAPGWRMNAFRGVKVTESWARQLRDRGVTELWVEGWRFAEFWSAIRAARAAGIRVWMRGENNDLAPSTWRTRLLKQPVLRWLFGHVDVFLTIGSANRRFYLRHGVAASRLHPAPYAVDNAHWRTQVGLRRSRRAELRAAWGIAPEACAVLFCGKLIEKKRPLDLIAAARQVPAGDRPLHVLLVGDGQLRTEVETALREPGTPAGTLTGFLNLSEIPDAFVAADGLVLPSDFGETWGLVVNEALASGLPVAASARCGCAEDLVRPLGDDLVFPCGDIGALARALRRLRDEPPAPAVLRTTVDRHDFSHTVDTVRRLLADSASDHA